MWPSQLQERVPYLPERLRGQQSMHSQLIYTWLTCVLSVLFHSMPLLAVCYSICYAQGRMKLGHANTQPQLMVHVPALRDTSQTHLTKKPIGSDRWRESRITFIECA